MDASLFQGKAFGTQTNLLRGFRLYKISAGLLLYEKGFYFIKCYCRFKCTNLHPDVDRYLQPVRMADMDELFGSDGDSDNEQRGT